MKIIYSNKQIDSVVSDFANLTKSDIELRRPLKEEFENFKRNNGDRAIGSPIPEAFVDLGNFVFAFFLGAMASGITYDLIKNGLKKLLHYSRNQAGHSKEFIISDGEDPNKFSENVYFFIPVDIEEAEFDQVFQEIMEINKIISELKKHTTIRGSLRFSFASKKYRDDLGGKMLMLSEFVKWD